MSESSGDGDARIPPVAAHPSARAESRKSYSDTVTGRASTRASPLSGRGAGRPCP